MKRLPGRLSKENGAPVEHNLIGQKSRDILADEVGESKDQVHGSGSIFRHNLVLISRRDVVVFPDLSAVTFFRILSCSMWTQTHFER